jgi:hypothetical protein
MNFNNITVIDMDFQRDQYPEFEDAFIIEAEYKDSGELLNDDELDKINDDSDFVYEQLQDFLH